jgi:hypothetical protein
MSCFPTNDFKSFLLKKYDARDAENRTKHKAHFGWASSFMPMDSRYDARLSLSDFKDAWIEFSSNSYPDISPDSNCLEAIFRNADTPSNKIWNICTDKFRDNLLSRSEIEAMKTE